MGLRLVPVLLSGLAIILPAPPPAAAAPRPQVFTHYFPWWNPADVSKFTLRPARGWYTNQWGPEAKKTVRDHIAQARAAGVAGFAFEWIGRSTPGTKILADTFLAANNDLPPDRQIRYCLIFDSVIWAMERKRIKAWYEPIPLSAEDAADMAEDLAYAATTLPSLDPNHARQYLHIDRRPAVYVYSAHSLGGAWRDALAGARARAKNRLYLIGDFECNRALYAGKKDDYAKAAAEYDAVTNFTPLNGYPAYATASIEQFLAEGEMDAALDNGRELAAASRSKAWFPGLTTQYFKVKPGAKDPKDRDLELLRPAFIDDTSVGYLPLARAAPGEAPASVARRSREAIDGMLDRVFRRSPELIFINSWNEPEEGTMIEPTATPNPAGYVMGDDFLRALAKRTARGAR
jgi:hypothetical protein